VFRAWPVLGRCWWEQHVHVHRGQEWSVGRDGLLVVCVWVRWVKLHGGVPWDGCCEDDCVRWAWDVQHSDRAMRVQ